MADRAAVKPEPRRTKRDKRKILEFYVLDKQLEFIDAIKDDDGQSPDPEAIKIFNDPFLGEKEFDLNNGQDH